MNEIKDSRYPYTYACDLIRHFAGWDINGMNLPSRSVANQIRDGIALVLGMSPIILAEKLSDYYIQNEEELTKSGVENALRYLSSKA